MTSGSIRGFRNSIQDVEEILFLEHTGK